MGWNELWRNIFIQICTYKYETFYKSLKIEEMSPENEVTKSQEFSFKDYIIPSVVYRRGKYSAEAKVFHYSAYGFGRWSFIPNVLPSVFS